MHSYSINAMSTRPPAVVNCTRALTFSTPSDADDATRPDRLPEWTMLRYPHWLPSCFSLHRTPLLSPLRHHSIPGIELSESKLFLEPSNGRPSCRAPSTRPHHQHRFKQNATTAKYKRITTTSIIVAVSNQSSKCRVKESPDMGKWHCAHAETYGGFQDSN